MSEKELDRLASDWYLSNRDFIFSLTEAFTAGYRFRDAEVSELQDKIYHASRSDKGEIYILNNKIKSITEMLAIAEEALENYTCATDSHYATNALSRIQDLRTKMAGGV